VATSRKDSRDALATLLEAALVGDGLPVKTVSAHKEERLEGNSPLVVVLSRGSGRERLSFAGDRATFEFLVQVWVLQKTTGWTQEQAEDALDRIESLIAETFETNRRADEWEILEYGGNTQIFEASVAGVPYYVESIPTIVRLGRD
jgi:hypothetical protein